MNDYSSNMYSDMPTFGEMTTALGVGIGFLIVYVIFIMALVALFGGSVAGQSHMFTKAGQKPWKAIIPVYNLYILFDLSWNKHRFWFWLGGGAVAYVGGTSVLSLNLLISAIAGAQHLYSTASTDLSGNLIGTSIGSFLLAFAGFGVMLVFQIILSIKVARSYGKGTGYVWGLILIPEIFYMILGFGSAQYLGRNQPSLKQRQNLNGQDQYRYVEEMQTTDKER